MTIKTLDNNEYAIGCMDASWLKYIIDAFKREVVFENKSWYKPDFVCRTCGQVDNSGCSAPHPCSVCFYIPYVRGVFMGCLCDINRTKVVHVKEPHDIYGGRATNFQGGKPESPLANPFKMKTEDDRYRVIGQYRLYFLEKVEKDPEFKAYVLSCKNKTLACWCRPKSCHLDIVVEWLDRH